MARPTVQLGCQEGETGRSHWTAARHFASDARPGRVRFSCKSGTTEFANPTRSSDRTRPLAAARRVATARQLLDASTLCAITTVTPSGRAHTNTAYFAWSRDFDIVWLSEPRSNTLAQPPRKRLGRDRRLRLEAEGQARPRHPDLRLGARGPRRGRRAR